MTFSRDCVWFRLTLPQRGKKKCHPETNLLSEFQRPCEIFSYRKIWDRKETKKTKAPAVLKKSHKNENKTKYVRFVITVQIICVQNCVPCTQSRSHLFFIFLLNGIEWKNALMYRCVTTSLPFDGFSRVFFSQFLSVDSSDILATILGWIER